MEKKRPYGNPTSKRRNVYADDATWSDLKSLGQGNVSAGIREAVRLVNEIKRKGD